MSRKSELLSADSDSILNAALEGLELQRQRIESQIAQIRDALGKGPKVSAAAAKPASPAAASGKRNLSEAARKRIAAAQKKRWAEYRKQKNGKGA